MLNKNQKTCPPPPAPPSIFGILRYLKQEIKPNRHNMRIGLSSSRYSYNHQEVGR